MLDFSIMFIRYVQWAILASMLQKIMGIVHVYNQSIRKKDPTGKVQDLHAWRLNRIQSAFNNLKAEYRHLKSQFCLKLPNSNDLNFFRKLFF